MSIQAENIQNCKIIALKTNLFPTKKVHTRTGDYAKDVRAAKDGSRENNENERRSECLTCHLNFSSRSQLSEHMTLKHKEWVITIHDGQIVEEGKSMNQSTRIYRLIWSDINDKYASIISRDSDLQTYLLREFWS